VLPLCQIAFSVLDGRRATRWYRDAFGFVSAGGTRLFRGPLATRVQGLPRVASTCRWLVDSQEFFQLEVFEFLRPRPRPQRPDARPCDIGYARLGLHVADLEATLTRLAELATAPLSEPLGPRGARRVCVRDPEGILLELMEDDPRGGSLRQRPRRGIPVSVRSVTLSVPDLDRSLRFFARTLGLQIVPTPLHGAEHEALWGLAGAARETVVLDAGDIFLELVQYTDPVGRPWPEGYRISDQGIMNVAFGCHDRPSFERVYARLRAAGYRPNGDPLHLGAWRVVYLNDDQGFSVELLCVRSWYERRMGFHPRPPLLEDRRPGELPAAAAPLTRLLGAAPREPFRRAFVTGAAGDLGGAICRLLAARGTALVLLDRDRPRLEALVAELRGSVAVQPLPVDLCDHETTDQALAGVLAGGRIDLAILAAGVDHPLRLAAFDWRAAIEDLDANLSANLVLLARLVPHMTAHGGGHLGVVSSLGGLAGFPFETVYCASKAGLAILAEGVRAELGPQGITVTTILPGFLAGRMVAGNAFAVRSAVPMTRAAALVVRALEERRPVLAFPRRTRLLLALSRLLPAEMRDALARRAMRWR